MRQKLTIKCVAQRGHTFYPHLDLVRKASPITWRYGQSRQVREDIAWMLLSAFPDKFSPEGLLGELATDFD